MLQILFLVVLGLLPSLYSLWVMRKAQTETRARLRQAAMTVSRGRIRQNIHPISPDRYYLEGVGYLIGDVSCQFNARSGYLRCAVNPEGPCEGCRYYQPKELASSEHS